MSLKLTIDSKALGIIGVDVKEQDITTAPNWTYQDQSAFEMKVKLQDIPAKEGDTATYKTPCYMSLVNLTFNKQMYRPGEIHARLEFYIYVEDPKTQLKSKEQIANAYSFAELKYNFVDSMVTLQSGEDKIAEKYYVYQVVPYHSDNAFYVDFVIYSQDKKLTTEVENKAYVARRLFNDIAAKVLSDKNIAYSIKPNNKLSFQTVYKKDAEGKATTEVDFYDDYIHPYLVQYNESFYDLLTRSANRWGEFIYFEDGKLYLGRNGSSRSLSNTAPYSYSYYEYADESLVANASKDFVSNDDYLKNIEINDYIKKCGDFHAHDDIYHHKVMQSLLAMKGNVFDWTIARLTDDPTVAEQHKKYLKGKEDEYNKKFFTKPLEDLSEKDNHRVRTQYQECDAFKQKMTDRHVAEKDVNDQLPNESEASNQTKTYLDFLNTTTGKISYDSDDKLSPKAEEYLDKLEKIYKDIRDIVIAECAVTDKAPSGETYADYVDETKGLVNIPKAAPQGAKSGFKDALTTLQEKYTAYKNENGTTQLYCQFSNYVADSYKGLKSTVYENVLLNERAAARQLLCVDCGTAYQHMKLGDTFAIGGSNYVVTQVECTEDKSMSIGKDALSRQCIIEKRQLHFRIYAIKEVTSAVYYPTILPTGHIRVSGPQVAEITDTFDPLMKVRYRVKYAWNSNDDASPWLPVMHEMIANNSGSIWMMKEGTTVLLNYADGNIERPYIVGAAQTTDGIVPRATQFNTMNLQTPAGHAIRMTDGYGGGVANFTASIFPLAKLIQGFTPDESRMSDYGGFSKYYEGGIELTDRFGIYSIKTSTDERNISISSPYGDVNLNAFTGITISAPNGDVKIQGKNISIEAGNEISITSGKNIANGLLGTILPGGGRRPTGMTVANDFASAAAKKAFNYVDVSVFRHGLEVLLRPIRGSLAIVSYRDMLLQAGIKTTDLELKGRGPANNDPWAKWVMKNWSGLQVATDLADYFADRKDDHTWRAPQYGTILFKSMTTKAQYINWNDVYGNNDFIGNAQANDYDAQYDVAVPNTQDLRRTAASNATLGAQVTALETAVGMNGGNPERITNLEAAVGMNGDVPERINQLETVLEINDDGESDRLENIENDILALQPQQGEGGNEE